MSNTITNQIKRAMLAIVESSEATVQERLDAVDVILKLRALRERKDNSTPGKKSKLALSSIGALGSR